jgi:hypothetical protein
MQYMWTIMHKQMYIIRLLKKNYNVPGEKNEKKK